LDVRPSLPAALAVLRTPELRKLGRTLYHAGVLGLFAGLMAAAFYVGTDFVTHDVYERFAGIVNPKTAGQVIRRDVAFERRSFLIVLIPALGGLLCGLLTHRLAPETAGGGGNAYLDAFHRERGVIRKRVAALKVIASSITLGTGGSGGREGPTMQIGAAVGSLLARVFKVGERERRTLLVAGAAAGIGAVFRTPLGGAMMAVEILYRDDLEADAIVPSVIASVTAYSVLITLLGRGHEFALPSHREGSAIVPPIALPLFIVLGVVLSLFGIVFVRTLRAAHSAFSRLKRLPRWLLPAFGGALVGVIALAFPQVVGIGYGWLESAVNAQGWAAQGVTRSTELATIALLFGVVLLKIGATSCTIGSGGAAGDFGPAVFIGGLVGVAVGRLFGVLFPAIAPPAWTFGLVGMGALFGGIAHVPIASLIMVCEMAGSYDLIVPLMLAEGTTFLLCRRESLYGSQLRDRSQSPAHRDELTIDVLEDMTVGDLLVDAPEPVTVPAGAPLPRVVEALTGGVLSHLVVLDSRGAPRGVVDLDAIREILFDPEVAEVAVAADVMRTVTALKSSIDLHHALGHMIEAGASAVPIVNNDGALVGLISQERIGRAYHGEVVRRHLETPSSMRSDD
jgi:CIC family chloride channel protein